MTVWRGTSVYLAVNAKRIVTLIRIAPNHNIVIGNTVIGHNYYNIKFSKREVRDHFLAMNMFVMQNVKRMLTAKQDKCAT